jgi:hypothetical protein
MHLKRYQLLLIFWAILSATISGAFMKNFGAASLFLAPEYLGEVNFLSGCFTGFALGVYIMSWNITSFLLISHHFKFLASTSTPFRNFTFNNMVIPILFIFFYIYRLVDFTTQSELIKSGSSGTVINGSDIAQTRMYASWKEIKAGYGKSLNKAFGSPAGAIFVSAFLFTTSIAPLILGLLGNPYGWLGFAAIVGTRVLSAAKSRGNIMDSVLHPISIAALIYLIVYSYLVRGTVKWKGRTL